MALMTKNHSEIVTPSPPPYSTPPFAPGITGELTGAARRVQGAEDALRADHRERVKVVSTCRSGTRTFHRERIARTGQGSVEAVQHRPHAA